MRATPCGTPPSVAWQLDGVGGDLTVTTEAGAVEGRGLTSHQVSIHTEAGGANLDFLAPPTLLQTTTTLGGVKIRVPGTTAYAVEVRTEVGASSVGVDRNLDSPHRITVNTEVGGMSIERLT